MSDTDQALHRVAAALTKISPEKPELFTSTSTDSRNRGTRWLVGIAIAAAALIAAVPIAQRLTQDDRGTPADQAVPPGYLIPVPSPLPSNSSPIGFGIEMDGVEAEMIVFSDGDAACYTVRPLLDEAWCEHEASWAIPSVALWGSTHGDSHTAELYGLTDPDVASIVVGFAESDVEPTTVAVQSSDAGFGAYFLQYDIERNGSWRTITALAVDGTTLGSYDLMSECRDDYIHGDPHMASLCATSPTLAGHESIPGTWHLSSLTIDGVTEEVQVGVNTVRIPNVEFEPRMVIDMGCNTGGEVDFGGNLNAPRYHYIDSVLVLAPISSTATRCGPDGADLTRVDNAISEFLRQNRPIDVDQPDEDSMIWSRTDSDTVLRWNLVEP